MSSQLRRRPTENTAAPAYSTNANAASTYSKANELTNLWREALVEYNTTVDSQYRINPSSFDKTAETPEKLLSLQIDSFRHYRDSGSAAAKVRSWFADYIRPIKGLCAEISAAASVAFPAAGAIGMALNFFLAVADNVRADFDFLVGLLDEVGPCIRLLMILEKGMPGSDIYRENVVNVMASFLVVIGTSIKFMKKERANRAWHTILDGRSSELNDAADRMRKCLKRLSLATELISLSSIQIVDHKFDMVADQLHRIEPAENVEQMSPEALQSKLKIRHTKDRQLIESRFASLQEARKGRSRYASLEQDHLDLSYFSSIVRKKEDGAFEILTEWISDNQDFDTVQWYHGPAGVGKSHFAYAAVSLVHHLRDPEELAALGFVRNDSGGGSIRSALLSCIPVLAQQNDKYSEAVAHALRTLDRRDDAADLPLAVIWPTFFASIFHEDASISVHLVLDDITDASKNERAEFGRLVKHSIQANCRIELVVTASSPATGEFKDIELDVSLLDHELFEEKVKKYLEINLGENSPF